MKDWIKQFDAETQKKLYARAYDYMSYRQAYYDEDLTVEDALKAVKEFYSYEIEARIDASTENTNESV